MSLIYIILMCNFNMQKNKNESIINMSYPKVKSTYI